MGRVATATARARGGDAGGELALLRSEVADLRRRLADAEREADEARELLDVPPALLGLSAKLPGGEWSSFENVVRDASGSDLVEGSMGHRNDDEDGSDLAEVVAAAVNRLRAQAALAGRRAKGR